MRQQGIYGLRGVRAGTCHAWELPADATCATVARQVFRDAVSEVNLEPDLLDDCVLMASELAANTLHARAVAGTGGGGDRLVSVPPDMGGEPMSSAGPVPQTPRPGCPELWLYLRGLGSRRELVCKVFDGYRGWRHGLAPSASRIPVQGVQAVTGRGLQIVQDCPAAGGGTTPPGPGWATGTCAARPSGSRCPRRWRMPGWSTSPGCVITPSRPTSRLP